MNAVSTVMQTQFWAVVVKIKYESTSMMYLLTLTFGPAVFDLVVAIVF